MAQESTRQQVAKEGTGERESEGGTAELEDQAETEHMTSRHGIEENSTFCCGECSFQTNTRITLTPHLERSHSKHIYNNCNLFIFLNSKNQLNQHIKEAH